MENRKFLVLGAVGGFLLLLLLPLLLGSCFGGGTPSNNANANKTVIPVAQTKIIVVWGLNDNLELYQGVFQQFETDHQGYRVEYHKFTDVDQYRDMLVNQIAEGKGPDVAMINNTWLLKDKNKFSPFPTGKGGMNIDKYKKTFVGAAADDLIQNDDAGTPQIYGFAASVDSLALYFNKKYFRDYVLSSTTPSEIWNNNTTDDLISQVVKLNHPDLSFERFLVSGMAMGRADNITKATDILSLLMLQYGTKLYDDSMKTVTLSTNTGVNPDTGEALFPALSALQLYTSFALPTQKHYSWNDMITKREKEEYEIGSFASGKVAMIFGYSYTMDQILSSIKGKRDKGKDAITTDNIAIAPVPQVSDKQLGRTAFASYFPFVVPATSQYKDAAWDLILDLVDSSAQTVYFQKAHKPTSLPSLIDTEAQDPVYGIFALQASYARSLPLIDAQKMKEVFTTMIMDVVNGTVTDARTSITNANIKLQCLLDQYNKVAGKEAVNCLAPKPAS